jgi:hypothetical protein
MILSGRNPTYADAILDRLVHNAHRIDLAGDSLRRTRPRPAAKDYYIAGVYREKASGARADRPELLRMIADLQSGEVVVAERIDRISRLPLAEAQRLVGSIRSKGARLADASAGVSERQILWARLFHIRPETYKSALAAIINAHLAHPHARLWGNGTTSSSDGQFFRAAGRGARPDPLALVFDAKLGGYVRRYRQRHAQRPLYRRDRGGPGAVVARFADR